MIDKLPKPIQVVLVFLAWGLAMFAIGFYVKCTVLLFCAGYNSIPYP